MNIRRAFILFTWLSVLMALFVAHPAFAETGPASTLQTNKIYMTPFYRASLTNNQNVTYNLAIDIPDNVRSVTTSIVTLDVYISPTVTFSLWVDGQTCNNPTYTISTTFSSAGHATAIFDCTNRITREGNYTVTLRPSGANTGAATIWLDMTYQSMPKGSFKLAGTEYRVGDYATTFLQLQDDQGLPVNNATCSLNVFSPASLNISHPTYLKNAPMLYKSGSNGVYYYDVGVLPNVLGVYMMEASCAYVTDGAFVYSTGDEEVNAPSRNVSAGTYAGDPLFLNRLDDAAYSSCAGQLVNSSRVCESIYDFNLSIHFSNQFISNLSTMQLFYSGESSKPSVETLSVWNWTGGTWVTLPNTLLMSASAATEISGVGDFVSNTITCGGVNCSNFVNASTNIVRIRSHNEYNVVFNEYMNWLSLKVVSSSGQVQNLKGSSEMHVNDWFNYTEAALRQINVTTNQTLVQADRILINVTSIKNDTAYHTSLLEQIVVWVQSIFNWRQTDVDNNASTATNVPTAQSVAFVQSQYLQEQSSSIIVQLMLGGNSVTSATCNLNVYYPNLTVTVNNGVMSYAGIDGLYNYTWTPNVFGSHMARVNCSGGGLAGQVQSSGSLGVSAPNNGVSMQVIS